MATEMLLVLKEKWEKVKKEAEKRKSDPNDGKVAGESEADIPDGQINRKEAFREKVTRGGDIEDETYKELLARLSEDLKSKVSGETKGGGSKRKVVKKHKTPRKMAIPPPRIPPPGIPEKWTPVAKESDTRDLSKRPPFVKGWDAY